MPQSKEDYDVMREEVQGKPSTHTPIDMSAREFIMGRSKEIIDVPIMGADDAVMYIRIRARLTKKEVREHKRFLEMFQNPESINEEDANKGASKFLDSICLDESLNEEFWNSEDIDSSIAQELLTAFMVKAASTLNGVKKFRKK